MSRRLLATLAVAGAAVVLTACAAPTTTSTATAANGQTVSTTPPAGMKDLSSSILGSIALKSKSIKHIGTTCEGTGGFNDFTTMTTVTLREDGKIVDQDQLGEGMYFAGMEGAAGETASEYECAFSFSFDLKDPDREAVYTVEIPDRGEIIVELGVEGDAVFGSSFLSIGELS